MTPSLHKKGFLHNCRNPCDYIMVGDTGIEPVTSSV